MRFGLPVLVLLSACPVLLPISEPPREQPRTDQGRADAAIDGNASPDRSSVSDATSDRDVTTGSDAATKDKGAAKDTGPAKDAPVNVGCDPVTATTHTVVNSKMVLCTRKGTTTFYTQCDAHLLCSPTGGWGLCPASVYQSQHGPTGPAPALSKAWIAGCAREGGKLQAPTDSVCGSCAGKLTQSIDVAWKCATGAVSYTSAAAHLGLVTDGQCEKVGAITSAAAGYWAPVSAGSPQTAAVCCRP